MSQLVHDYGYWALFVGCLLEGETVLALAGFAAQRGYLDLPAVLLVGFVATAIADQSLFLLGHFWGPTILFRSRRWHSRIDRAKRLLNRYDTVFIMGFRFLYGLRVVSPFIIGMSGVAVPRFVFLNLLSVTVWTATVGLFGFSFGHAFEIVLRNVVHYEIFGIAMILAVGATLAAVTLWRRRR